MLRKLLLMLCILMMVCTAALADVTPNGEFPVVDAPAELTIWTAIPGTQEDYTNNATTKYFEVL